MNWTRAATKFCLKCVVVAGLCGTWQLRTPPTPEFLLNSHPNPEVLKNYMVRDYGVPWILKAVWTPCSLLFILFLKGKYDVTDFTK